MKTVRQEEKATSKLWTVSSGSISVGNSTKLSKSRILTVPNAYISLSKLWLCRSSIVYSFKLSISGKFENVTLVNVPSRTKEREDWTKLIISLIVIGRGWGVWWAVVHRYISDEVSSPMAWVFECRFGELAKESLISHQGTILWGKPKSFYGPTGWIVSLLGRIMNCAAALWHSSLAMPRAA